MYIVYCHTNKVNGKRYFGITNRDPQKRWGKNGCKYLKKSRGSFQHPAFANAIIKYGWDSFEHEILFEGLTLEEANKKEIELIATYKTNVNRFGKDFGYNMTDGGDGSTGGTHYSGKDHPMYGKHHTEEARKKMSAAQSGENNPMYGRTGERGSFYGHHHTEEYKELMRVLHSGKNSPMARRVICVETGEVFDTLTSAAKKYGLFPNNISKACKNIRRTSGGLHWQYTDEKAAS